MFMDSCCVVGSGAKRIALPSRGDGSARAGLAHVQCETIHPFLDGNGRVGRLLITFLLCHAGVIQEPLLYHRGATLSHAQGR